MPGSVRSDSELGGVTDEPAPLQPSTLKYLQRPPTIVPNYGRKKTSLLPKSSISRVLLYDNVMQQQMLDVKLNSIKLEKQRTGKILDLHRKSFLSQQSRKQHMLQRNFAHPLPEIPARHNGNQPKNPIKIRARKHRRRSLPTECVDLGQGDGVLVPLGVEPTGDFETVQQVNDSSLPEINGLHLVQIESQECRGITKSLLIQTESVRPEGQDDIDNPQVLHVGETETGREIRSGEAAKSDPLSTLSSPRTSNSGLDPRFLSLKRTLQQMDHHTEGFAELSPSFTRNYAKIPDYLLLM